MTPKARPVSQEETAAILRETAHEVDAELTRAIGAPGSVTVYKLADGSAIMIICGLGAHWESHSELVATYQYAAQLRDNPPRGRSEFPQQEHFIDAMPELLRALPGYLGLDPATLRFSEASLDLVDGAVSRLGQERVLTPDIFPSVLAYVGEVIRRAVGGRWEMRREANGEWEPWITAPGGTECAMFLIYKGILEEEPATLSGFASFQIQRHGGRRP